MPNYSYCCLNCGHNFEKFVSFKNDPNKEIKCEKCNSGNVKKKIELPVVKFVGSGFYSNDSKEKND